MHFDQVDSVTLHVRADRVCFYIILEKKMFSCKSDCWLSWFLCQKPHIKYAKFVVSMKAMPHKLADLYSIDFHSWVSQSLSSAPFMCTKKQPNKCACKKAPIATHKISQNQSKYVNMQKNRYLMLSYISFGCADVSLYCLFVWERALANTIDFMTSKPFFVGLHLLFLFLFPVIVVIEYTQTNI